MRLPDDLGSVDPDSWRRRQFLASGAVGLAGSLAAPYSQGFANTNEPVPPSFGRARACILVYLLGGPSHIDLWDLKPKAPAEIRGPFQPVETQVPGVWISEHLPQMGQQMSRCALVRSVSHPNHNHTHMIYYTLTGRHMTNPNPNDNIPNPPNRSDHPHLGSVVAKFRPARNGLPGYVALPELSIRMQPVTLQGGNAGFLGPRFDPLPCNDDPREPVALRAVGRPPDVSVDRFGRRESLLAVIDGRPRGVPALRDYAEVRQAAVRLLSAPGVDRLFLLDKEPPHVRDRYGRHRFGQSLLLARRLVEAGVPLVAIHFNSMSKCDGWDTHAKNFDCLKNELTPMLDQGLSALIDDLAQRGRLDETLVVCMGEFGRTPRINPQAGRDHWGSCSSVVLAGAGVRGGQVLGSSDKIGAYPSTFPLDPADFQATIYHSLGIQPEQTMVDPMGRPMPLSMGRVVKELF